MIKYRPVNALGIRGNITYIFLTLVGPSLPICTVPAEGCNLVCDGAFESGVGPNFVPHHGQSFDINVFNWRGVPGGTPDYFIRNTPFLGAGNLWFGIPSNFASGPTFPNTTAGNDVETHNGAPNDRYVGQFPNEPFYGRLLSPLTPGSTYNVSFWIRPAPTVPTGTPLSTSVRIFLNGVEPTFITNVWTQNIFTSNLIPVATANNGWTNVIFNFVAPAAPLQFLVVEMPGLPNGFPSTAGQTALYHYIDDFSITEANTNNYTITSNISTPTPCIGQSLIVNYQLCYTGPGATNNSPLNLQVTIPNNTTIVSGNFNASGNLTLAANSFVIGQCITLSCTLNINNGIPEGIPQNITLSVQQNSRACVPGTNNTVTNTFTPQLPTPLTITKQAVGGNTYLPGQTITYRVNVCNTHSSSTINNIQVRDILPAGLNFQNSADFTNNVGTLTSAVFNLQPASCRILEFTVLVQPVCNTIQNCASIINSIPSCNQPLPACTSVTVSSPVITASGATTFCQGNNVTFMVNTVSPGFSYQWLRNGTDITGATNSSYVATTSGSYSIRVFSGSNNCISNSIVVNLLPQLNVTATASPSTICSGPGIPSTLTASGGPVGTVYTWTGPGLSRTGSQITVKPNVTTTYTVTANNGCIATAQVTVDVIRPPLIVASGSLNPCVGGSVVLSLNNPMSGQTYQWLKGGLPITGATSSSYTATSSGMYRLDVTQGGTTCTSNGLTFTASPIIATELGTNGVVTPINAGGGTMTFSGNYHINGIVELTNGTFHLLPGTVFYIEGMSGIPGTDRQICPNNLFSVNYNYIHVKGATFRMTGATLRAACDEIWGAVVLQDNATIITEKSIAGQQSVIQDAYTGIYSNVIWPDVNNCTPPANAASINNTNRMYISDTRFFNNFFMGIWDYKKGSVLAGEGIRNSTFSSNPASMKKPYNGVYSIHGMVLHGEYQGLLVKNCNFNNLINGVNSYGANLVIEDNIFRNVYSGAIWIDQYSNLGKNIVRRNFIEVPSRYFSNSYYINANNDVMGIVVNFGEADIIDNTISGSNSNPAQTPKQQIGIWGFGAEMYCEGNSVQRVDIGTKSYIGFPHTYNFQSNTFANNINALNIWSPPYTATANIGNLRCNTFQKTGPFPLGTTYGIKVNQFTNMPAMGSPALPNGNNFSGLTEPFRNDGNTSFDYWHYIQEVFTSSGSPGIVMQNSGMNVTAGSCPGSVGLRIAGTSNEDIKAMKDSISTNNGNFADLKYYQSVIIDHHVKNNSIDSLESYTATLPGRNKEAFNTFGLFLMEKYRSQGKEDKAQANKNLVLINNDGDQEVHFRAKYFDVSGRMRHKFFLPLMKIDAQDSTDLADISASGTSLSEVACIRLRNHYPHASCNIPSYDTDVDSQNNFKESIASLSEDVIHLSNPVPNPANTETTISYVLPVNTGNARIIIMDIANSRKIVEYALNIEELNGQLSIDLSSFKHGIYSYSLEADGKLLDIKKLAVIK